jgi:hypothetical protein
VRTDNETLSYVGRMQLYTTYDDLGEVEPARAWAALRSLRSGPPQLASKGARKRVFAAALEQAQQLYEAAADVGVATKPILVFYGLSQAGRAVAAARSTGAWELSGHGIKSVESVAKADQLASLSIKSEASGSFGRLAEVLNSSSLANPTRIGDLWPLLAETRRHPLPASGADRSLGVTVDARGWQSGIASVEVEGLPSDVGAVGMSTREALSGLGADYSAQADAVDQFLSRYPTLHPRMAYTAAGQPIGMQSRSDGTCSVKFQWSKEVLALYPSSDAFAARLGTVSRGKWRAYPSLDGGDRPIHPLLVWWAILFRLSMLARYEPQAWERFSDVNVSADAVPLEHILNAALSAVPELIFHVLTAEPSDLS